MKKERRRNLGKEEGLVEMLWSREIRQRGEREGSRGEGVARTQRELLSLSVVDGEGERKKVGGRNGTEKWAGSGRLGPEGKKARRWADAVGGKEKERWARERGPRGEGRGFLFI